MRKIDNYFSNIPPRMKEERYRQLLKDLIAKKRSGQKINASKDIKDYAPDEVKEALLSIFGNNCAYCECDPSSGSPLDTEHFRSKSIYYWLAYEWSNFLRACKRCNSNKAAKFDINGKRCIIPNIDIEKNIDAFIEKCHILEFKEEDCKLLHPALEEHDPLEHLWIDEYGVMHAKSDKGQFSIDKYKLNRNSEQLGDLVKERKGIIEKIRLQIERAVREYNIESNENALYRAINDIHDDILIAIHRNYKFSATRQTCFENFKPFFIDKFTGETEIVLNAVYIKVREDIKRRYI